MAINRLSDFGGRSAPVGRVARHLLARGIAMQKSEPRRALTGYQLGLDDAMMATFGYDRRAFEQAGRGQFPL